MKVTFVAILLLVTMQKNFAQANNDLAGEGLKGKVKAVTELLFYDGQKKCGMKTVDKYDRKGYLAEEIHNDYVLKIALKKYLKYDTAGNGNIAILNEFDDSGILVHTIDYRYDSQNHIVEEEDYRTIDDISVVSKKEYYYDSTGNKAREKNYTDGELNYTTDYTYDNKGRTAATRSYDKNDSTTILYDYHYMENEQWVQCEKQSHGIRTHFFRTLDTLGVPIKQTMYGSDFSKETIENYSNFDKHGNWLKLIVSGTLSEPYEITRAIEYYD